MTIVTELTWALEHSTLEDFSDDEDVMSTGSVREAVSVGTPHMMSGTLEPTEPEDK